MWCGVVELKWGMDGVGWDIVGIVLSLGGIGNLGLGVGGMILIMGLSGDFSGV